MRSSAGERPPPPIASAPSSSDRRLKGHRDLREAASPQRIRLATPWESYNRTATGFAPLTGKECKPLSAHDIWIDGEPHHRGNPSGHESKGVGFDGPWAQRGDIGVN